MTCLLSYSAEVKASLNSRTTLMALFGELDHPFDSFRSSELIAVVAGSSHAGPFPIEIDVPERLLFHASWAKDTTFFGRLGLGGRRSVSGRPQPSMPLKRASEIWNGCSKQNTLSTMLTTRASLTRAIRLRHQTTNHDFRLLKPYYSQTNCRKPL